MGKDRGMKVFSSVSAMLLWLSVFSAESRLDLVEKVKQAVVTEARADWWGFDGEDASECLQQAIRSGVRKLRIGNMGRPWIVSRTIHLVSDQEIVFEDGVEILAKKGAFQGTWLGLFAGNGIRNTSLRGEGNAVFRMRIGDYTNPKLYRPSEHRHGIYLSGCRSVMLKNLTVKDTGGDGLAVGNGGNPCRGLLVENVTFDNNNRLGISIVSGEDIVIRNCRFLNARHRPPSGGIDLEPNSPAEVISGIRIEDCVFLNNKFNAVNVAVCNLDETSKPVSVLIRNCRRVEGNTLALWVEAMKPGGRGCRGNVTVENCRFSNRVMITNCAQDRFSVTFRNTEILPPPPQKGDLIFPAVVLESKGNHGMRIGGVAFENVRIADACAERPALALNFYGRALCDSPFSGTLLRNGAKVDLVAVTEAGGERLKRINALKPPLSPAPGRMVPWNAGTKGVRDSSMPIRRITPFLLYAEKGRKISFRTKIRNFYKTAAALQLFDPAGTLLRRISLPDTQTEWTEHSFLPEKTGIYQILCDPGINSLEICSDAPSAYLLKEGSITFAKPSGRMYFTVPAGTREFSVTASGSPNVDVRILDPSGKCVLQKEKIAAAEPLTVNCAPSAEDRVWSIELRRAVWEAVLNFHAPLVPLLAGNPAAMLAVK